MKLALLFLSFLLTSCSSLTPDQRKVAWHTTGNILQARAYALIQSDIYKTAASLSQSDQNMKSDIIDGLASAFWAQLPYAPGDVAAIARAWTPDKTHWVKLADDIDHGVKTGLFTTDTLAAAANQVAAEYRKTLPPEK